MSRDQYHRKSSSTNVTDLQRVTMAAELLKTAKLMQVVGLKRILGDIIEHPLIPREARVHAEEAFALAVMLEEDIEWRGSELKLWLRIKKLEPGSIGEGDTFPRFALGANELKVPVPRYILNEPTNLRRALDLEIAEVGMITAQLVYEDMIAETSKTKTKPGGVFRDGSQAEAIEESSPN